MRQPPLTATANPHKMDKSNRTVQRAALQKCWSPPLSLCAPLPQGYPTAFTSTCLQCQGMPCSSC